jgi:hypothetical protein
MKTLTLIPNIEETLEDWFASYSLELKKLYIYGNDGALTDATGEFHPCLFDKETDGKRIEQLYLTELAHVDERFSGTNLIFISDTEFKIL